MLLKIGTLIFNTDSVTYIDLCYEDEAFNGIEIAFTDGTRRYFYGQDAEVLWWYFTHPTSKVKDLIKLKG